MFYVVKNKSQIHESYAPCTVCYPTLCEEDKENENNWNSVSVTIIIMLLVKLTPALLTTTSTTNIAINIRTIVL